MKLTFQHVPDDISRFLEREAARRRQAVEDVAIEALKRGIAFAEGPDDSDSDDDEEISWLDNPAFERALKEFALIDDPQPQLPSN